MNIQVNTLFSFLQKRNKIILKKIKKGVLKVNSTIFRHG